MVLACCTWIGNVFHKVMGNGKKGPLKGLKSGIRYGKVVFFAQIVADYILFDRL